MINLFRHSSRRAFGPHALSPSLSNGREGTRSGQRRFLTPPYLEGRGAGGVRFLLAVWIILFACHAAFAASTITASTTIAPAPPAPPAQTAAPANMEQAYQLGYDIYLPIAQLQFLNHEVASLQDVTSDAEKNAKLADLDKLADRTRSIEQLSMKNTADQMQRLGVPESIRSPYEIAAGKLAQPLATAKDAEKMAKHDPVSARILSTMEEANQLIPTDMAVLTSWVKVARGANADWGLHVGTLEASLAVASDNNAPGVALLSTVPPLVAKAPQGAPAGAKDAMLELGHDIEKEQDVTQPMLAQAAQALHRAFEGD